MNRTHLCRLRLALLLAFCFIWVPAVSAEQVFPPQLGPDDQFSGNTWSPGTSFLSHHWPQVNDPSAEPNILPWLNGNQSATFKPAVYFQDPTPTPPSGLGSLIGLIADATSGERLAGVTVSVDGQTTITNPVGVYRFDKVTPGLQTVVARSAGYQTAQQARQVIPNELVWNSMTLQRAGDPTATPEPAFTPTATPSATATPTATEPALTPTATLSTTATTTSTSTPSPSATTEPTIMPTETLSATVTPTTTHTPTSLPSATSEPALTPTATPTVSPVPAATPTTTGQTGSLIGLITNAQTGERLAGVFVSAIGQLVQTGSNGLYLIDGLPAGPQLVTAARPGFETRTQTGVVVPNETRWNSIALNPRQQTSPTQTPVSPPSPTSTSTPLASATPAPTVSPSPTPTPANQTGTLVGLITDADTDERLADVIVSVAGQSMVTAADGIYRFESVPAGPQVVTAEREGYQTGQKTRVVMANEVRWNSIKLTRSVIGCPTESEAAFDLIPVLPAGGDPHPDFLHGDLNLAQRGYSLANASLGLQNYAGDSDPNAPQLAGLFEPNDYPGMSAAFRVNHWDWSCGEHGCRGPAITDWPATLIGLPTRPGQAIYIPERSPQIYSGGFKAVVLYAEEKRLTLGYTREDSVAFGYAVHLENVCVDPNLLALYRAQNDAAGFRQSGFLPALHNDQTLGAAFDNEIMIAIRDRGAFLDPRSRKDWWRGF